MVDMEWPNLDKVQSSEFELGVQNQKFAIRNSEIENLKKGGMKISPKHLPNDSQGRQTKNEILNGVESAKFKCSKQRQRFQFSYLSFKSVSDFGIRNCIFKIRRG